MKLNRTLLTTGVILALACVSGSAESMDIMSRDPYAGAIVIDAASGDVLFEDKPDARAYPASVTKLMVLLLIQTNIQAECGALLQPPQPLKSFLIRRNKLSLQASLWNLPSKPLIQKHIIGIRLLSPTIF